MRSAAPRLKEELSAPDLPERFSAMKNWLSCFPPSRGQLLGYGVCCAHELTRGKKTNCGPSSQKLTVQARPGGTNPVISVCGRLRQEDSVQTQLGLQNKVLEKIKASSPVWERLV